MFPAPNHPALEPAIRTVRGWRDRVFLSREFWRDFDIEGEIIRGDLERLAALSAGLVHILNSITVCFVLNAELSVVSSKNHSCVCLSLHYRDLHQK